MPNKIKSILSHLFIKQVLSKTSKCLPRRIAERFLRGFLRHGLTIVCCALITGLGIAFLVWSTPETTIIGEDISTRKLTAESVSQNIGEVGASYIIYTTTTDGTTTIYAKNGSTGKIDFSGTDASTVINNAISALTSEGGTIFLKEIQKPENISAIPSNVIIIEHYKGNITLYTSDGRIYQHPQIPYRSSLEFKSNFPPISFVYLDRLEDVADWSIISGSSENDTTNFREGKQGIKVTSVTGGSGIIQKTVSLDLSQRHFSIWVYIHDVENLDSIWFGFSSIDGTWNHNYGASRYGTEYFDANGWFHVSLVRPDFGITGTPSWGNITRLRLQVKSKAGVQASVTFDDYRAHLDEYTGKVTLRFDDVPISHWTIGKKYMDKYGYRGVIAVVKNWVDQTGQMSLAQLKVLNDQGWDISSHGVTHTNLTSLTLNEVEEQLYESQKYLLDNGFIKGARFFCPPGHAVNQDIVQMVKKYYPGMSRIRVYQTYNGFSFPDPYLLSLIDTTGKTSDWVKSKIDTAIANNLHLTLLFHGITDETWFSDIIDYFNTKGVEVLTLSDIFDRLETFKNRLKSSGTATITAGQTSTTTNHGLAGTPSVITVTATSTAIGNIAVTSKTSTQFTITSSATSSSNVGIYWKAEM